MLSNLTHLLLTRLPIAVGVFLLLITSVKSEELNLTSAQANAYYTIEMAKQITWPNESDFDLFVVGIIGGDKQLNKAFEKYSSTKVRGKRFIIEDIEIGHPEPKRFAIIFTTNKVRSNNSQIFHKFSESLIITEGKVDRDNQLIKFFTSGSKMKIRMNRDNIAARGFKISVSLLEFAGTKEDLSEQLRENSSHLKKMLIQEQQKENNIEELNNIIAEKTALLESAKTELEQNKQILEINRSDLTLLKQNLQKTQSEMNRVELGVFDQRLLLQAKQEEILSKQDAMAELQASIKKNTDVLRGQVLQIEKQNKMMQNKDQTIESQRDWLNLILWVMFIFFVMTYFLLRTNRLRKQANEKLNQLNSKLFELATTDSMTGLSNRRHFLKSAQKELLRQQRNQFKTALLMIDIDYFKNVNDSYGHTAGDTVIKSVANHLKNNMRSYDLVGRFGGEEYVMMLVDCDIDLANEIAQRLCNQVAKQTIQYQKLNISITISIGLSQLNEEDVQIEQAIVRADKALYQAKHQGRNQVVIFNENPVRSIQS